MACILLFADLSLLIETQVFVSSRLLFFLSKCGHAPEWCSKVFNMPFSLGRVPIAGVLITGACGTLAYMYLTTAWEVHAAAYVVRVILIRRTGIWLALHNGLNGGVELVDRDARHVPQIYPWDRSCNYEIRKRRAGFPEVRR